MPTVPGPDGQSLSLSDDFGVPSIRQEVADSDLVILEDVDNDFRQTCVYGKSILHRLVEVDKGAQLKVCRIPLRFNAIHSDLELMLAIVEVEKWRHEYQDGK